MRRKFQLLAAILAGIAMAGLAKPARADFEVVFEFGGAKVTLDRTTSTTTTSGGASTSGATIDYSVAGEITVTGLVVSPTGTTGGFKISSTIADSNNPGTSKVAEITLSSLQMTNRSGSSGTLTITEGDTGFTAPAGNVTLHSTISATASGLNLSDGTVVFNSYLDTNNGQNTTSGAGVNGTSTINLTIAAGNSKSGNADLTLSNIGTPYSVTEVGKFTLGGTSTHNDQYTDGSTGTDVLAPAPSGLVLAASAVLLTLPFLRRRRVKTISA
jgi:hypothetical protein